MKKSEILKLMAKRDELETQLEEHKNRIRDLSRENATLKGLREAEDREHTATLKRLYETNATQYLAATRMKRMAKFAIKVMSHE
jgi:hypothetical protein